MGQNKKYLILIIFAIFFCSCRFNYEEAMFDSEFDTQIPKTILINYKQVTVKDNENTIRLEAERAESYDQLNKIIISGMYFYETDNYGNKLLEGWADKVVYYTETENAEVYDSIYIYSFTEEAGIFAENLLWNKDAKLLSSEDDIVTLKKDDGSIVSGRGFKADLRRKDIQFDSTMYGTYFILEDND